MSNLTQGLPEKYEGSDVGGLKYPAWDIVENIQKKYGCYGYIVVAKVIATVVIIVTFCAIIYFNHKILICNIALD